MAAEVMVDGDYATFVQRARRLVGVDLNAYKPAQMQRRLTMLAQRHGSPNLTDFAAAMEHDPATLTAFKNFFTINVSEFLRDPPRWHDLVEKVLPGLFGLSNKGCRRALRVWSAGCSNGAEPYSLAMLLEERAPGLPHKIVATDIDEAILARARAGRGYLDSDVRNIGADRRERCFARERAGTWAVRQSLQSRVRFLPHDLLGAVPERNLDLIICRNVVIYFTEEAKRGLYQRMFAALRPGGVLFVGGTEVVAGARDLGLDPFLTSFYRKPAAGLAVTS